MKEYSINVLVQESQDERAKMKQNVLYVITMRSSNEINRDNALVSVLKAMRE